MNKEIRVSLPDGEYSILIVNDFAYLPLLLKAGATCAIITNPRVGALYAHPLAESLRASGAHTIVIEMPDGEQFKTLDTLRTIYDQLIDAKLDRQSTLLALGGGVVGDVTGLAAATFMRGVPLVQLPTTLLAMVDSSIGGKVAVDHPRGKNLIGAFKQPRAVIANVDTLETLPDAEWRSGMAEVVKHGILGDAELFEQLAIGNWQLAIANWLPRAIQVKVDIVTRDPFERGERAQLNLGHTFGHAIEQVSNYSMRHGEAVAIGLVCAARLGNQLKLCDANLVDRIERLLRSIGLPTRIPRAMSAAQVLGAMQTDKKRLGAKLRLIVPRALGQVMIVNDVPPDDLSGIIEESRE